MYEEAPKTLSDPKDKMTGPHCQVSKVLPPKHGLLDFKISIWLIGENIAFWPVKNLHADQLDVIPGGTSSQKSTGVPVMPDIWAWSKEMESEKICAQKYGSQFVRFFYLSNNSLQCLQ